MISIFRKLFFCLTNKQKRELLTLFFCMLAVTFFEMLGIAAILPVLSIMTSPDFFNTNPIMMNIRQVLGNPSHAEMVIFVMFALVLIYSVRSGLQFYFVWFQSRCTTNLRANISQRLFYQYLNEPYSFHLQSSSANLIRNTNADPAKYSKSVLSALDLLAGLLSFFGIFSVLVWLQPVTTLVISAFILIVTSSMHLFLKKRMEWIGKKIRFYESGMNKFLLQGYGSIKEVILLNCQKSIGEKYWIDNVGYTRMLFKRTVFAFLPKAGFEIALVVGMFGLVLGLLFLGNGVEDLVPIMGVFAVAAFRILPIVSRCFVANQTLYVLQPGVDQVVKNLKGETMIQTDRRYSNSKEIVTPSSVNWDWGELSINNLFYRYQHTEDDVLGGLNIRINKGDLVGFIGESGGGKSTLINILIGLLQPTSGDLLLDGAKFDADSRDWQKQIGYVAQSIYLVDDTIRNNIAFGQKEESINQQAVIDAVNAAQLGKVIASFPQGLDTNVGEAGIRLSGGQKQRIGIARALYHNPSILVFDEASSALDVKTESQLIKEIENIRGEKTIIIVSHRLAAIKNCDRIFRIKDGIAIDQSDDRQAFL